MKLAAVSAVSNLTNLDHEVNQVLDAEQLVVGLGSLLVDGFHKEPVLIQYLLVVCVDPPI